MDQVVGQNRAVAMQDRTKMPYTDAVIHELQRFIDVNPFGMPRSTAQDTEFAGYVIPKVCRIHSSSLSINGPAEMDQGPPGSAFYLPVAIGCMLWKFKGRSRRHLSVTACPRFWF